MIRCKDCRFWYETPDLKFGNCICPKFEPYGLKSDRTSTDAVLYQTDEGLEVGLVVGKDFGCIHGEPAHGDPR
jgi:hypothetical protein